MSHTQTAGNYCIANFIAEPREQKQPPPSLDAFLKQIEPTDPQVAEDLRRRFTNGARPIVWTMLSNFAVPVAIGLLILIVGVTGRLFWLGRIYAATGILLVLYLLLFFF